jgi:hypothetical protein
MTYLTMPGETNVEEWYRYEDVRYAPPLDEWDEPVGQSRLEVVLHRYRVKHHTPTGVRLTCGKFVSRVTHKRYACPTLEEAKESFVARKKKQIAIYEARIYQAKEALKLIEKKGPFDL